MPHPTHRSLPPSDSAHFRACLSRFATGVTIIAARADDGRFVGLTASSFNSLSHDPPLILWSLDHRATTLEVFKGQRFFSVSVLAVDQVRIARRFAARSPDRFKGVAIHEGLEGIPLIDGALAWFECERLTQLRHGDHWLFIGEVKRCAMADGSPLIFRHGEFAVSGTMHGHQEPASAPAGSMEPGQAPFYEEYLPYLLARAGHNVTSGFHHHLRRHGLSMLSWRLLASLAVRDDWTVGDLAEVCLAKQPTVSKMVDRLEAQQLVRRRPDPADARRVLVGLTAMGRERIAPVLTDASAFNLSVLASYPPESLTAMKDLLKDMIARYPVSSVAAVADDDD
jgi:flavin reductase (DIM6/NTAB) family NADH-FMN oxidoreductase RutF/DNA-binding MarR family transcriptional regulator